MAREGIPYLLARDADLIIVGPSRGTHLCSNVGRRGAGIIQDHDIVKTRRHGLHAILGQILRRQEGMIVFRAIGHPRQPLLQGPLEADDDGDLAARLLCRRLIPPFGLVGSLDFGALTKLPSLCAAQDEVPDGSRRIQFARACP